MVDPIFVPRLRTPTITVHVRLDFKLIFEALTSVQHLEAIVDELVEGLHMQDLLQEWLNVAWTGYNKRIGVEGYLFTGTKSQGIAVSAFEINKIARNVKENTRFQDFKKTE